jgi:hypothetical protein
MTSTANRPAGRTVPVEPASTLEPDAGSRSGDWHLVGQLELPLGDLDDGKQV